MILYIAARSVYDIGSETHYKALQQIFGKENVIKIDLRMDIQPSRDDNYIAYGKYNGKIERIKRWLQGNNMYMSDAIINDIERIIGYRGVDIVFTEESFLGKLIYKIKKKYPNITVICFYHDIGADIYRQRKKRSKGILKLEEKINIKQEKINVKCCDKNIVFHKEDYNKFYQYYGKYPDKMIPLASFPPKMKFNDNICKSNEKKEILFVCSSYYPNIIGIRWFYKNVLPKLPSNLQVNIVGRGIDFLREEFKDSRVKVVGFVEKLDTVYPAVDIVIAPIFEGGGMKVKTMEAVSFGKYIVGTSESLHGFWEGIEAVQNKIVFQCDSPDEWVGTLTKLVKSDIKRFNKELYDLFLEKFSYDSMLKQFKELFSEYSIRE